MRGLRSGGRGGRGRGEAYGQGRDRSAHGMAGPKAWEQHLMQVMPPMVHPSPNRPGEMLRRESLKSLPCHLLPSSPAACGWPQGAAPPVRLRPAEEGQATKAGGVGKHPQAAWPGCKPQHQQPLQFCGAVAKPPHNSAQQQVHRATELPQLPRRSPPRTPCRSA